MGSNPMICTTILVFVAQLAEAIVSDTIKYEFESHRKQIYPTVAQWQEAANLKFAQAGFESRALDHFKRPEYYMSVLSQTENLEKRMQESPRPPTFRRNEQNLVLQHIANVSNRKVFWVQIPVSPPSEFHEWSEE